ncbi:MAG: hypothetical protein C5S47_01065 [Candidatus Methanogasteraceae archaeon]|nr:MAG: hypothetical protein C5S47_01065 [ANME-2 cluster archaeon]
MIVVRDGIYTENVVVNKSLTITIAENGSALTIIQAANPDDGVFEVTADYVNISGFTVTGVTGTDGAGFYLYGADYCNISGNNVSDNDKGIYLSSSNSNNLANNTANRNDCGIHLSSSSNNTLAKNNASLNKDRGIYMDSSSNNKLEENTANWNNGDVGCSGDGCEWPVMIGSDGSDGYGYGIYLSSSSNNTLTKNTANLNGGRGGCGGGGSFCYYGGDGGNGYGYGIYLYSSSNNTLTGNIANLNCGRGGAGGSGGGRIGGSTSGGGGGGDGGDGYGYGIRISSSSNNVLTENIANSNNGDGGRGGRALDIDAVAGSSGSDCGYGIRMRYSSYNTLYYNNLIANVINAYDSSTNQWNSTTAGNYYSDYNGTDPDGDGIGNDPHPIPGGLNMDHYPLIAPWCNTWTRNDAVTAADARVALQIAARGGYDNLADVNGDGRITALDSLMIVRAAASSRDDGIE